MYLRQSNQKRADGSFLSHLQIAESVWDPVKKRSRVRIVYNCGRSDDPAAAQRLRRLANSILKPEFDSSSYILSSSARRVLTNSIG